MTTPKDINTESLSRRSFLKTSSATAAGLVIAFYVPSAFDLKNAQAQEGAQAPPQTLYPPNAFVQIAPDGTVTITVNRLEMGQGVNTSFAQLINEELGADWSKVKSVASNADSVYNTPGMPFIITGGSMSIRTSYDQYRKIGAAMREMLIAAAARKWNVSPDKLRVENGYVINGSKKLSFGELASAAAQEPLPKEPKLKSSKEQKTIGQSTQRLDAAAKSNGTAIFGMDVRLPGMLYAMLVKPPMKGAKLASANQKAALAIPGVVKVLKYNDRLAVIAKNTHAAHMGQQELNAKWTMGVAGHYSTAEVMKDFKTRPAAKASLATDRGTVDAKLKTSARTLTMEYEFPFLSHSPMEPMNCTVDYDGKTAKIYGGFQMPTGDHAAAAKVFNLPTDKVEINVTYAGGSFGRRASKDSDWVVESCEIGKLLKKPVKVVWSREDDMQGGYYRPITYHHVHVGLDDKNHLTAWDHHIVGESVMKDSFMAAIMIKPNGVEETIVGGASDTKYAFENFRLRQTAVHTLATTLWLRSVENTHTGFVMETMIDELATAAGVDPFVYRRELLAKSPKHIAVLDLLEKQTGWGKNKPPEGRAWGLAIHDCFESCVGYVAEVSLDNGQPKVHRLWSAAHVGRVVNPEGVKTQIEGGVVFGLSQLHQEIEIKKGIVVQKNFDTYPVMRMHETPHVEVALVDTDEAPTGIGEPGAASVLPAVANALFRLTGKRIRKLPISSEGVA